MFKSLFFSLYKWNEGKDLPDEIFTLHTFLEEHFLCTKVYAMQIHNDVLLFAVTSVGKALFWPNVNQPHEYKTVFLEKSGLSALHACYTGILKFCGCSTLINDSVY